MGILLMIFIVTAIAAVGSLVFDGIALRWHYQDRQRFEADEKREADLERRVTDDEAEFHVRAEIKSGRPAR